MMRETPRTFVGSVAFLLDGPVDRHVTDAVRDELERLEGITYCDLDTTARTLVVTAATPVERTDVVGVLDRLGVRVRA